MPPFGRSKRPILRRGAGERALLVAEQLALDQRRATARAVDRDERRVAPGARAWIARAISSLPVPVSPRSSTVASVGATCSAWNRTPRRPGLSPTISSKPLVAHGALAQVVVLQLKALAKRLHICEGLA